ncbi:hypothetical protein V8E36_004297 [Tilletia maclaganii]
MLPSSARIQLYTLVPLLSSPSTTNSSSSLHPFCAFARSFASCSVRACCVVSEMFSLSMTARRVDLGIFTRDLPLTGQRGAAPSGVHGACALLTNCNLTFCIHDSIRDLGRVRFPSASSALSITFSLNTGDTFFRRPQLR